MLGIRRDQARAGRFNGSVDCLNGLLRRREVGTNETVDVLNLRHFTLPATGLEPVHTGFRGHRSTIELGGGPLLVGHQFTSLRPMSTTGSWGGC